MYAVELYAAVRRLIFVEGRSRRKEKGAFIVKPWRGGDIYAYPHEDGGVVWGFQTSISSGGFCVARGVKRN
jgi:hypothetical protein